MLAQDVIHVGNSQQTPLLIDKILLFVCHLDFVIRGLRRSEVITVRVAFIRRCFKEGQEESLHSDSGTHGKASRVCSRR
jgi:hypothetical protein